MKIEPQSKSEVEKHSVELTQRQKEVINIIQQAGEISFRNIVNKMKNPPVDRTIRDEFARLKSMGLIDTKGFGRGAFWYLIVK